MGNQMSTFWWNLKNGIRNLWVYFPVIWKTREFDHEYLMDIMRFKIGLMKESMSKQNIIADKEVYVQQMQDCLDIMNRLKDDNYCNTYDRTKYSETDRHEQCIDFHYMLQERELDYNRLFSNLKNNLEGWWW